MRSTHFLITLLVLAIPAVLWPRRPPFVGPPSPLPACHWVQEPDGVRCGTEDVPSPMSPARKAALGLPVDVNHASLEELETLDGIGPALAARIVAARPFASVDDVARVRGIGARRLARLRPRLVADSPAASRLDD
jgi:competence protein ComEA